MSDASESQKEPGASPEEDHAEIAAAGDAALFSFVGYLSRRGFLIESFGIVVIIGFIIVMFRIDRHQHCLMEPDTTMGLIYFIALGTCLFVLFLAASALFVKRLRAVRLPIALALVPAAPLASVIAVDRFGGLWPCDPDLVMRLPVLAAPVAGVIACMFLLVLPKGNL